MDAEDHDLEGEPGSAAVGSADVRRSIPIKLISERGAATSRSGGLPWAMYKSPRHPSPDREGTGDYADESFRVHEDYGRDHDKHPKTIIWDCKINIFGKKDDIPVHFCDKCGLPIKVYGRMIPCKHVFCFDCASLHEQRGDKSCPGCVDQVQRIEQCLRGTVFLCNVVSGCKRTYLSQRDLQAHINHRHVRHTKPQQRPLDAPPAIGQMHPGVAGEDHHSAAPVPGSHEHYAKPPNLGHDDPAPPPPDMPPHPSIVPPSAAAAAAAAAAASAAAPSPRCAPQESYRITTITTARKHCNLITVPIQGQEGGQAHGPPPQPPRPPHHMHFGAPPSLPMSHPPAHMAYSQPPPPIVGQRPPVPFMGQPPPPLHYTPPPPPGPLTPPYSQPPAVVGLWGAARPPVPPPPRGPIPPPGSLPPSVTAPPDQARYRPYYQ